MMKKFKKILKNQKGLTLVELLAVIVILGIIAAIAVPSIGNIIEKSKADAHEANAEMLISAARMGVAANEYNSTKVIATTDDGTGEAGEVTMANLVSAGYLESAIKDPDTENNYGAETKVKITKDGSGNLHYQVTLDVTGDEDKTYGDVAS